MLAEDGPVFITLLSRYSLLVKQLLSDRLSTSPFLAVPFSISTSLSSLSSPGCRETSPPQLTAIFLTPSPPPMISSPPRAPSTSQFVQMPLVNPARQRVVLLAHKCRHPHYFTHHPARAHHPHRPQPVVRHADVPLTIGLPIGQQNLWVIESSAGRLR